MKKLWKLLKNNRGEVLEAILAIPVFLTTFFMLSFQMDLYKTRNSIEDTTKIVSRYIADGSDLDTIIARSNNYIMNREDRKFYCKDPLNYDNSKYQTYTYFSMDNIVKLEDKQNDGSFVPVIDKNEIKAKFSKGDILTFEIMRYNNNFDNRLNTFTFGGKLNKYEYGGTQVLTITLFKDNAKARMCTMSVNGGV